MKPSRFTYHRPTSVSEARQTLADCGVDGKVLAGGQSLIPILNMRLAAPRHLVDINRLTELATVATSTAGVEVGALVRHAELAADDRAAHGQPLLRKALGLVAHPAIRNRGTTVGSLVHADPAAEMPAVLLLVGGSVRLVGPAGERDVPAREFFLGAMESDLQHGELAVSATFPALPPRTGCAVLEISRRKGDYALCGVAVTMTVSEDQMVTAAHAAYFAVDVVPVLVELADLVGTPLDRVTDEVAQDVGRAAASGLAPKADIHATGAYRSHLAGVLTARAVTAAAADLVVQQVAGAA